MPRVHHVKRAAKDYPHAGIEKGQEYWYWTFRYGGKVRSATYPRPSQLTQSKWSQVLAAQEALQDAEDLETFQAAITDAVSNIEEVGGEYEEAAEHFGGEGENRERADRCEELVSELQDIECRCDEELTCPNCDTGTIECEACGADGRKECKACFGEGVVGDNEDECDECGGDGRVECPKCDGSGAVECGTCDGNGTVSPDSADEETVEERLTELRDEVDNLEWDNPC